MSSSSSAVSPDAQGGPGEIVDAALRRVLGDAAGQFLRSDTPIWDTRSRVALLPGDAVALAEAIAVAAREAGGACLIEDEDVGRGDMTVGDLVEVVARRWQGAP